MAILDEIFCNVCFLQVQAMNEIFHFINSCKKQNLPSHLIFTKIFEFFNLTKLVDTKFQNY
jgi:hypothetical protein